MGILPIDSGRYGSKDIKDIFEEQKRLDFILEFEAATALAQSNVGIIPCRCSQRDYQSRQIRKNHVKQNKRVGVYYRL